MGKLRDSARKSGDWNACCLPIDVEGVSEVISRVSEAVRSDSTKVLRHVLPVRSLEATLQLAAKKFKTLPPVIDVSDAIETFGFDGSRTELARKRFRNDEVEV